MKLNQLFFRGIFVFLMLGSFSAFAQPANDLCSGAIEIQCNGISILGSTLDATNGDSTNPGIWYKFVGEGSEIVASTCDAANFDTIIEIYSGVCGGLSLETLNDDGLGCGSFTSQTEPLLAANGVTYYILVQGWSLTETGDFTLTLTCTDPPPALENDECPDAIGLVCGDSITGSTEEATDTGAPGICEDISVTAPGVWYTVEGTGGVITLDTCGSDFDTKLSVYSGACGNFDCVAANDDDESFFDPTGLQICGGSNFQSSLEFDSTAGTLYYIYVHGFGSSTGNFNLNVDCACFVNIDSGDCQTVYLGAGEYASDTASLTASGGGAGDLIFEWNTGQYGESIDVSPTETTVYTVTLTDEEGCTSTAETTVVVVDADCDNNGNADKVEICHRGETICVSMNAVQAHLNHGDSIGACDQLNCDTRPGCSSVTYPEDGSIVTDPQITGTWSVAPGYVTGYILTVGTSPGGTDVLNNFDVGNTTSFDTPPLLNNTTYYVTVTPYNNNGSALSCPESSFTTDFTPANDLCAGAISVACGDSVDGDTTFATSDDAPGYDCDEDSWNNYNGEGVWYTLVGTGEDVVLSLCDSEYDTKISVYTGECGALNCYAGNDDNSGACGPGFRSEVQMAAEDGVTYYIYVSGFTGFGSETDPSVGGNLGLFTLDVTCIEPPVQGSDDCADAVAVACGDSINGTTVGYTDSGVIGCDAAVNNGAPGVWYKIEGTGDMITLDTCGSSYDTKLSVYSGDCTALVCVAGNDDDESSFDPTGLGICGGSNFQSSLEFPSVSGVSYYIYISGFSSSSAGDYNLNVSCTTPAAPAANPNRGIESLSWGLTPNPSKGDVELDLGNFIDSDVTVDVIGFTGKLLASYKLEDLQNPKFNLQLNSSLTNGMYLVRVSSNDQVSSKRLIINR